MTDIATVEEVEAGGHTVRVGHTEDGSWEAVVLEAPDDDSGSRGLSGGHMAAMITFGGSSSPSKDKEPAGPVKEAPHKWVAVGFAIEAREWQEAGDSEVLAEVEEAYDEAEVSVDAEDVIDELEGDFE